MDVDPPSRGRAGGSGLGPPRLYQWHADQLDPLDRQGRLPRRVPAHYVLGPFGPETDLRRWGPALAARGGANAKKRAVVAVARKLATLLHHFWVTDVVYQPLRQAA